MPGAPGNQNWKFRKPRPMPQHGTTTRYGRGCRCLQCRAAESERHARYVATGTTRDPYDKDGIDYRIDVIAEILHAGCPANPRDCKWI